MSQRGKKIMSLVCGPTSKKRTSDTPSPLTEPTVSEKSPLPSLNTFTWQNVNTMHTVPQPVFVEPLFHPVLSENVQPSLQSIAPIVIESNENKETMSEQENEIMIIYDPSYENCTTDNSVPLTERTVPEAIPLTTLDIFNKQDENTSLQLDLSKNELTPIQPVAIIVTESIENKENIQTGQFFQVEIDKDVPTKMKIRQTTKTKSYEISPIHSNESDVDTSDIDPTYCNDEDERKLNIRTHVKPSSSYTAFKETSSSSSSDSSSSLESDEPDDPQDRAGYSSSSEKQIKSRNTRKRQRNPSEWKQNKAKKLKNSGQPYISVSKSKKNVPAKRVKPSCPATCRLKCSERVSDEIRQDLFTKYWKLGDLHKQRLFVNSCLKQVAPRYQYSNARRPRQANRAFYLTINNEKIRVCKVFFKNTFDITERMIRTVIAKSDEKGFVDDDKRGQHNHHNQIDPELLEDIRSHINSIPRIESHYLRANTSREFIDGGKTITDLFRDFQQVQLEKHRNARNYSYYNNVFNNQFNLGFFQPKKDGCDQCLAFENANPEQKQILLQEYNEHHEEKQLSRKEKKADRENITESRKVVTYDLQAVLQCPKGDSSAFYYKSKLNSYNFTLAELTKKEKNKLQGYENVHCFYWTETDGKRGANEIGSNILKYLEIACKDTKEELDITFFSDNCCGQNKNRFIATLYLYALNRLNIKSITHKFLIKGHTQNEGDNVHKLIETEIRKNLKSGPIYSPHQYVALMKNAKKKGLPFTVHELDYSSFFDLKQLQEQWGSNFNVDTAGKTICWNGIKVMKFVKEKPFSFFIKSSYKQTDFIEVNVRKHKKKLPKPNDIKIQKLYSKRLELAENKKKDLKDLLTKNLIPQFYCDFYDRILL